MISVFSRVLTISNSSKVLISKNTSFWEHKQKSFIVQSCFRIETLLYFAESVFLTNLAKVFIKVTGNYIIHKPFNPNCTYLNIESLLGCRPMSCVIKCTEYPIKSADNQVIFIIALHSRRSVRSRAVIM